MDTETETAVVRTLQRVRGEPSSAERDALLDALSHRYRRFTVAALEECGGPLALADLAADVADREADGGTPAAEQTREIEIELYHIHVPKLAAVGLVTFDREQNAVRLSAELPE